MELLVIMIVIAIIFSSPKVKGILGEKSVGLFLGKLDPQEYKVFHDLYIPIRGGKTSQIDHVVVSKFGLFVIETKNYKGWIYGSDKNKYWTQVIYKRKEKFFNPIHQNYSHIKALQEYLNIDEPITFHSIIVFTTRAKLKKIDIQDERSKVIYSPQVSKIILKQNRKMLSPLQVKQMINKLENVKTPNRTKKREHVQTIKAHMKEEKRQIRSNTCPKCGGNLVSRVGRYGEFKGCSNYPKCRFVSKQSAG
jgi:Nuclease-related domain/Topoisomerase DNA binding C4 zinc finger